MLQGRALVLCKSADCKKAAIARRAAIARIAAIAVPRSF
jgi:hypothetical protein